ncbi:hypothetical protein TNCV_2046971 [Trichonephila clavipes]|uniref:Uncharacterized protein n=1 Tax=Trichonephila clavipes TaxID=2585209 RepID=A0A8X6T1P3_TRICX|nr:hypothetical protein TNCV_2046971 [Trichonephila clavipes]
MENTHRRPQVNFLRKEERFRGNQFMKVCPITNVAERRDTGQGLDSLKTFCTVMSLPNTVEQKSYDVINNKLSLVMKRAGVKENSSSSDNILTVSGDGTWKTRGHSSLIGVCAVCVCNRVWDRKVLSSF